MKNRMEIVPDSLMSMVFKSLLADGVEVHDLVDVF